MAHPICALARPLNLAPVADDPRNSDAFTAQAVGHINALKELCQAAACLRRLVASWLEASSVDTEIDSKDVRALMVVVHAEGRRRLEVSKAFVESMS